MPEVVANSPVAKRLHKNISKQSAKADFIKQEQDRKRLLINLFPYVDESKLAHNVKEESAIQKLWEDEHSFVTNNNLALNEAGLITFLKDESFKK